MTSEATRSPHSQGTEPASKRDLWIGRALSGLAAAFLLFDGGMKVVAPPVVVKSTVELGYPEASILGIGLALLVSTVLYLVPRTAVLGAILLTGYLGGAVATHVRVGDGAFKVLFPVLFGIFVWGGLALRVPRVRRAVLGEPRE